MSRRSVVCVSLDMRNNYIPPRLLASTFSFIFIPPAFCFSPHPHKHEKPLVFQPQKLFSEIFRIFVDGSEIFRFCSCMSKRKQPTPTFADALIRGMEAVGITNEALGERTGFAPDTIYRYRSGRFVPPHRTRKVLMDALELATNQPKRRI